LIEFIPSIKKPDPATIHRK